MARVFLSAGHGGSDPGAVAGGLAEKNINLQTLLACKAELELHGVEVIASRLTDEYDPVGQEVKEANASGANLAVSFHANAGSGDGFEAFYWNGDSKGKRLAELCEKQIKAIGQNSRGIKSGNHLYFIKNTNMTAVLVESFFVDNIYDRKIGDEVTEQQAFGRAYAKAILEYLGIDTKVETKPSANPVKVEVAKKFNAKFAKSYTTIANLNLRAGAGTDKTIITVLPKGTKVRCYGYYSLNKDTKWLYVATDSKVGFVSEVYLR